MDKKQDDILTNVFRERLENYKFPVSDEVWKKIEQDLPMIPKKNKHLHWLRIGIAVAATIAILIGLNQSLFHTQTEEKMLSHTLEKQPEKKIAITENPEEIPSSPIKHLTIIPQAQKVEETDSTPQNEPIQETKEQAPTDKSTIPVPNSQNPNLWINTKKQKAKSNTSLTLAYGGQGIVSLPNKGNHDPLSHYSRTFPDVMNVNTELPDNPIISDIQHKTPITLGLSIRKYFSSDWALETGLTYTYLESTKTSTYPNGDFSTKNSQLNYIGIPLKVVYSFYTNNRLSLYTSAGGMVEKNIYGKEKHSTNNSTIRLKVPELQWSISGNIGLNYKLVDNFDLFAEPGIGYYFDDKSGIETIRKDKPWDLSIQVGIRFNLK